MATTIPLDGVKALKLRILVNSREGHSGVHGAGRWLEEGVNDVVLESDEGATGKPVLHPDSGAILPIYTLNTKLCQLYILEGRRQLEGGKWSEPRFELPDQTDTTTKKPGARAPQIIKKIEVLDRMMSDGVWESDKRIAESAASALASAPKAPQLQPTRR